MVLPLLILGWCLSPLFEGDRRPRGNYDSTANQSSDDCNEYDSSDYVHPSSNEVELELKIHRFEVLEKEVESLDARYKNIDFLQIAKSNYMDASIRKELLKMIRYICLIEWAECARAKDFEYELPSSDNPFVSPWKWEDLPDFLEEAFLPRFSNDMQEIKWLLNLLDEYRISFTDSASFLAGILAILLRTVATLETLAGKAICEAYGSLPDPADPNYWSIKNIENQKYCLDKNFMEMLAYTSPNGNPYYFINELHGSMQ